MNQLQQQKIQREEAILLSLKKFDYLTRSQLQRLHHLSGDRNARRVLNNMGRYISSFRSETGEKVYHLNQAGKDRIGGGAIRHKSNQIGHYLMRNDLYLHLRPTEWKNEVKISVEGVVSIVCDAYFKHQQRLHFLEVDRLQQMFKNKEKIERYRTLKKSGVMQERYKYFPRLVWVTLTENRKRQLVEWCDDMDCLVYVWEELK